MLPVVRDLVAEGVPVSIDTTRAAVAEAALEAGATIVNDVSGGLADPAMARVVAQAPGAVDPHALARPQRPDAVAGRPTTTCWARSGPSWWPGWTPRCWPASTRRRIVLDPGLGFAKTAAHNWALLRAAGRAARRSGSRCWSAPPASGSWRAARRRRRRAAPAGRPRGRHGGDHARWPPWRVPGGCGCTTSRRPWTRWRSRRRCSCGRGPGRGPAPDRAVSDRIALRGLRVRGHHGVSTTTSAATGRTSSSTSPSGWTSPRPPRRTTSPTP